MLKVYHSSLMLEKVLYINTNVLNILCCCVYQIAHVTALNLSEES